MKLTDNTILITGGGTGIGRGLAEALHARGNQVIIAGRRQSVLDETARANPGMRSLALDIESPDDLQRFVAQVKTEFPSLNVLINNAGIMKTEDLRNSSDALRTAEQTIAINLLGPISLTGALLPQLLAQPRATVMTVSSGLASVPLAPFPTYCATKAAIHSWTQSLRYQLRDTSVEVLELAPPYVQTELTGSHQSSDPNAMPLADYISETMMLLENPPVSGEILVQRVHPLRYAERNGNFDQVFAGLNSAFASRKALATRGQQLRATQQAPQLEKRPPKGPGYSVLHGRNGVQHRLRPQSKRADGSRADGLLCIGCGPLQAAPSGR